MTRVQKGFTLIELMIVVAIIAVLAAIALPAYQDYLIRSQVSEGLNLASGARSAVWEYTSTYGVLPVDNASAGLPAKEAITGSYVAEVEVGATGIQVTYGNNANAAINGSTLILAPTLLAGSGTVNWECTGGTLAPNYRPANCR